MLSCNTNEDGATYTNEEEEVKKANCIASKVLHCDRAHKIDKSQGHIYDANISISRTDRWMIHLVCSPLHTPCVYTAELEHAEAQQ